MRYYNKEEEKRDGGKTRQYISGTVVSPGFSRVDLFPLFSNLCDMPKKRKQDDSHESNLFRNAPESARKLLKSAHSGARLKAREDFMNNKLKDQWTKGV